MTNESAEKATQLYAAYIARRKQYTDQIKEGTNATWAGMLAHAAATTDLCLTTYVYFAEQITELSKRRQEENATADSEARGRADSALARVEEIKQELLVERDPALQELLLQEAEQQVGFAKAALGGAGSQIQMSQATAALTQALFNLNHSSLEQLLTVSNAEDVRRVLGAISKALVGMIPVVGGPLSALLESWALWQERRPGFETGAQTTSDTLDKLDAFIYAGYQWCLMVQLAVDALNGVSGPDLDRAVQLVKSRFDALVSSGGKG